MVKYCTPMWANPRQNVALKCVHAKDQCFTLICHPLYDMNTVFVHVGLFIRSESDENLFFNLFKYFITY